MLENCPFCSGKLTEDTRKIPLTYKGETLELNQKGQWCDKCGEGFLNPEEAKAHDEEIRAFHNRTKGKENA